jgi:autotransporter-associated beta strand protein
MGFRIITFCLAVFGMLDAGQTGYQWDANGSGPGLGGSGSWSEGGLNWDLLGTGSDDGSDPCVAPAFGVAVQAVFAGTGGMVTLDSGLQPTLIGLKLASAGYELTGGPGTMIQLAGDDPWIETEDDASITAILSSPNRWTKRGPSTLLLTGTNTFPNGLLIREGSLLVRNAAALGSGPIQIGNASSDTGNTSLVLDAHPTFVSNPVTIAHSGPGVATLRSTTQGGGSDAVNGFSQVILQADAVIDSNALGSSVISSLSGSGNLTVAGTGKTILPGPNTFSGNVTVSTGPGGSLQIGSGSGSPNVLPDDSILHVQADSIVRMEYGAGGNETIGAVTGGGTIWLPSVTSPPGKSLTVGGGDKSGSFQGRLTAPSPGLQRLIKIGNGTQSLTGTNSDFSGGVRIFGGVLEVAYIGSRSLPSSIGRPATGADGLVIDGGTFRHIGPDSVTDRGFTIGPLGAAIEASGTGKLDFQGYTGTGDAIVLSDTFTPRTLTLGGISSADNRINLVIPDKGTGSTAAATTVVKTGPGTWILSANNSFTGQLRILDGTLSIPRTTDYGSSQPMGIGAASSTKLVLDGGCLAMTAATNQAWSMGFQVGQNGGCINVSQPNVNFVWNSNRTSFHLDGTLELATSGTLRFIRSATGAFNRVHGGGSAVFRGSFDIVTDTTNLVPGSRWRLVETATATYSEEFSIPGFTRQGTIHTRDASGLVWSFDEGSGELSVTFAQIPPDFASWANLISDTSLRGAQDDPDGDGLTNLSEYLFGSMPHIPSGAVILSEYDVAHLVLRWNQIQSGASYQLQQGRLGEDFKWEPSPEPVAPDPVQTQVPPGWTRMRAVIPVGHNQQFFRVQAAIP